MEAGVCMALAIWAQESALDAVRLGMLGRSVAAGALYCAERRTPPFAGASSPLLPHSLIEGGYNGVRIKMGMKTTT